MTKTITVQADSRTVTLPTSSGGVPCGGYGDYCTPYDGRAPNLREVAVQADTRTVTVGRGLWRKQ